MFANWVQVAEFILLPLGLGIGYTAGRICRREERASFRPDDTVTHPGVAQEYPAHAPFLMNTSTRTSTWPSHRIPGK
jgi:hypothetical protein